ncbi:MAG: hypothetical protein Kow00109_24250 [Acidobacteriota bacterium]
MYGDGMIRSLVRSSNSTLKPQRNTPMELGVGPTPKIPKIPEIPGIPKSQARQAVGFRVPGSRFSLSRNDARY